MLVMLTRILDAYSIKTAPQQQAFIKLLILSGCFEAKQLRTDLEATGHDKATVERFVAELQVAADPTLTLDKKFEILSQALTKGEDSKGDYEKLHQWLIKVTQREFFAREAIKEGGAGQDRWTVGTGQWIKDNDKVVRELVEVLALALEKAPTQKEYDAIAVFGSTAAEMTKRLRYAMGLINGGKVKANTVYLLAGERPADDKVDDVVDGKPGNIATVAAKNSKTPKEVTETHLIDAAYDVVKTGAFATVPKVTINAKKGTKIRPTTIDTLLELSAIIRAKDASQVEKNILFISGAPNVAAQREDALDVMGDAFPAMKVDVAGDACDKNLALNRIVGALGGSLYGGYPRAAKVLGNTKTKDALKTELKTLGYVAPKAGVAPSAPAQPTAPVQAPAQALASSPTPAPASAGPALVPAFAAAKAGPEAVMASALTARPNATEDLMDELNRLRETDGFGAVAMGFYPPRG